MTTSICPYLMFKGNAEEALNFYVSLFENSKIENLEKYPAEGDHQEGKVKRALFNLNGHTFICADAVSNQDFAFTPALSFYMECPSEEDIKHKFRALSQEGKIIVAINNFDPDHLYGWVQDKFGVSWQLNFSNKGESSKDLNLCFANNKEVRSEYKY